MIVETLVLLSIAWRSTSLSIEISNAKISMSTILTKVKEIKNELKHENERLLEEKQTLNNLLETLKIIFRNSDNNLSAKLLRSYLEQNNDIFLDGSQTNCFETINQRLEQIEKTLNAE
ncbi:MAG: hypothetical protein PHS99_03410 [Candidatus Marinimicrobia bacterium]|nr:hypothetical protein [Candidatus Neomarinimicrobiota bacterium]